LWNKKGDYKKSAGSVFWRLGALSEPAFGRRVGAAGREYSRLSKQVGFIKRRKAYNIKE
jgi:hypothetical protein